MRIFLACFLLLFVPNVSAQLYFPPNSGTTWETTDPATLGWCPDSIQVLYNYLESKDTKAFIILKNGRIVLEQYFGDFTADSVWAWNSAGKTLTSMAIGIAQADGFLTIEDTTSDYLGTGWTSLSPAQEEKITIRHQLTMTTGLNDTNFFCTDPACLTYLADPGTRWAYHNAPYTLLDDVIANATGQSLNSWVQQKIKQPTGMTGFFLPIGYNTIYYSTARSMARYGLLLEGEGIWNGTPVLNDATYFYDMTHSSQNNNESYGYLTWLNGQNSYMVPQSQIVFPGEALPNAPADMYAALGKNGQIINVVPSQELVVIRMGNSDGDYLVPTTFNDSIWYYINRLSCPADIATVSEPLIELSPNPSEQNVTLYGLLSSDVVEVFEINGKRVNAIQSGNTFDFHSLEKGTYLITINRNGRKKTLRFQLI